MAVLPSQARSLRQFFIGLVEGEDETRFPRSVPMTLHFRERNSFCRNAQLCGTNRVEGISDRIQQGREWHTLVSTTHQHNGGRTQADAWQVDAFLSACASNVYEANRSDILYAFGNCSDDRPCGLSPQVVDDDIDPLSELLYQCFLISQIG